MIIQILLTLGLVVLEARRPYAIPGSFIDQVAAFEGTDLEP